MKWMRFAIVFASSSSTILVDGFSGNGGRTTFSRNDVRLLSTKLVGSPSNVDTTSIHDRKLVLNLSDSTSTSNANDQKLLQQDPIGFVMREFESLDKNAFINTAVIVGVAIAVLNQFVTVDASIMRGWTASEMAMRIPVDNWLSYSAVLNSSPISTKAVTSATVYAIGDFIAQRVEGLGMGEIDRPRLLRSLLAGLIGHGPLSHLWYNFSEDIFENVFHWTEWWGIFPKVLIDQTTWGPFWNNTYILLLGLMQLNKPGQIFDEMKRTTIPLIVSGLKLWPLCHCITYGVIPLENRLLWVDLVEIVWVTILATAAAGGGQQQQGHGAAPALEVETEKAR